MVLHELKRTDFVFGEVGLFRGVRAIEGRTMQASVCILSLLSLMLVACSNSTPPSGPAPDSEEVMIDSTANGTTISYPVDERFCLELLLSADAGFQWDYTLSDTSVVCIDSTCCRPASGDWNQVGGYTIESFHFRTIHSGLCSVHLIEHQAWIPEVPPIHTCSFTVAVN